MFIAFYFLSRFDWYNKEENIRNFKIPAFHKSQYQKCFAFYETC